MNPLEPLPTEDGPVFEEVWQAQALGMADLLIQQGVIDAGQWSSSLGQALAACQDESAQSYYIAVISALEKVLGKKGIKNQELAARKDAWIAAYRQTPHGQPVKLQAKPPGL